MADNKAPSGTACHDLTTYQRLYQAFTKRHVNHKDSNGCKDTLCYRTTPQRPGNSYRLIHLLIPSVYAAENVDPETVTVTERVAASRPKIHISEDQIEDYLASETGMDRLRDMFREREGGRLSPELDLVKTVTERCALLSFIVSSVFGSLEARDKFVEGNKHTKFSTKLRAKRSFNDAIFMGGMKTGVFWAVKTGAFTALFLGTSQCIAVYRNKTSPLDYVAGAALTGGLFKINLGLRGFVAGGIIGGVLGAIGGLAVYGMMHATSETQEQRHYWTIHDRLKTKREIAALQIGTQGDDTKEQTTQPATELC